MKVLGPLVFNYVEKLLKFGDESFIREGCKILKVRIDGVMLTAQVVMRSCILLGCMYSSLEAS